MAVRRKMGRPARLESVELREKILSLIRDGNYKEVAARACGIKGPQFSNWLAEGRRRPDSIFGQFYEEMEEAEADAESRMVRRITTAAEIDPKEAHWWLARKFPERWARKEHIEHTGPGGGPIAHAAAVIVIGGDKDSYLAAMTKAVTELQDRRNGKALTHDVG